MLPGQAYYTPYTPYSLPSRWGDDRDYIWREAARTSHFHNTLYYAELQQPVLRLFSLVLWDYYAREEVRFGPTYDLRIVGLELETINGEIAVAGPKQSLAFGYDNLMESQDCALNCNEKCRDHMPLACTKYKTDAAEQGLEQGARREGVGGLGQPDSSGYNFQHG